MRDLRQSTNRLPPKIVIHHTEIPHFTLEEELPLVVLNPLLQNFEEGQTLPEKLNPIYFWQGFLMLIHHDSQKSRLGFFFGTSNFLLTASD